MVLWVWNLETGPWGEEDAARWEGYIMSLSFLLFDPGIRGILDISIESRCGVDDAFDVPSSQVPIFSRSYSEERMMFDLRIVRYVICDERRHRQK
jgi:hypothetical protein